MKFLSSTVDDNSACPVWFANASKSLTAPGSVATIFSTWPDVSSFSDFLVLRIGSGQESPRASSSLSKSTVTPPCFMGLGPQRHDAGESAAIIAAMPAGRRRGQYGTIRRYGLARRAWLGGRPKRLRYSSANVVELRNPQ